jgi:hypothetical protein
MRRAVVNDPEHPPGLVIRRLRHHLGHQPVEGGNARLSFTAAKESGVMDIKGCQVGPSAATLVLMFHPLQPAGTGGESGMQTAPGLDAGFLVCREDELIVGEGVALPKPRIEIQESSGLGGKVGDAGENPAAVGPRTNGIFVQPAPHRAVADRRDQTRLPSLTGHVGPTESGERKMRVGGQLTRQGFNLDDDLWGEKPGGGRGGLRPPSQPSASRRIACATG